MAQPEILVIIKVYKTIRCGCSHTLSQWQRMILLNIANRVWETNPVPCMVAAECGVKPSPEEIAVEMKRLYKVFLTLG